MIWSKTWWDINCCMRWSCFVKVIGNWQDLMVVALLYEMQSPCNCFTLSLSDSDSRRSNSWGDDNDAKMEIKVSRRWQWWSWRCFGDDDQRHKMMMAISYHLYWLHVMFIFYASYLALIDDSIIRWSLTKLSRSVLPEYAPLRKFFVLRHHVMIRCDRFQRPHTTGVR